MWTVEFLRKDPNSGLVFSFTDGSVNFERTYGIQPINDLKRAIQGEITRREEFDNFTLPVGPFDPTIPPNQFEINRQVYRNLVGDLSLLVSRYEHLVRLGIIKQGDDAFESAINQKTNQIIAQYDPAFEGV